MIAKYNRMTIDTLNKKFNSADEILFGIDNGILDVNALDQLFRLARCQIRKTHIFNSGYGRLIDLLEEVFERLNG